MPSEVARPEGSAFELFKAAGTDAARWQAGQYAVTPVPVPGFRYPVPPLFFDLPWNDDNDEIVTGILAGLASAVDLEAATQNREPRDLADLAGQPMEILGVAARSSDVEDARWGAYLMLTVSVNGGPPEVVTTGAGEVCVLCWRLHCEGRLPAKGVVTLRGAKREGRKQPVGIRLESDF